MALSLGDCRPDEMAAARRTDIVELVGEVTTLRRAGRGWKGRCPFHEERTASLVVWRRRGVFKCYGCGAGGDVVAFVERHWQMPFRAAVHYLAKRAGR